MNNKIERLKKLNSLWIYSSKNFQFYKNIAEKHEIHNINNFKDWRKIPVLTKEIFKENSELINKDLKKIKGYIRTTQTGGSTSSPTFFPQYSEDINNIRKGLYSLRKKSGLNKVNRDFIHVWGHSHLINKNHLIKKVLDKKDQLKRLLKNEKLISGYDPLKNFDEFVKAVNSGRYSWIIGYTTAILCLSRYIKEKNINLKGYIQYIILSAETISNYSLKFIEEVFNCKVIKEYGLAEIGVLAYSSMQSDLYFFDTENFHIEGYYDPEIKIKKNEKLLITTLNNVFPLIRYCPDDTFKNLKISNYKDISCSDIYGRAIEEIFYLPLLNGELSNQMNEVFIVHCLKTIKSVAQTTCYVKKSKILKKIRIYYTGQKNIEDLKKEVKNILKQEVIDLDLDLIKIEISDNFLKTIAGKNINYIVEN